MVVVIDTMKSILVLMHCESNTGYAIGPLEETFFRMALSICEEDTSRIHFAYPSMRKGSSKWLPAGFGQYLVVDATSTDIGECRRARAYIQDNDIDTIFGFDQPVNRPIFKHFRQAGVKSFISYWGAPMSSKFGALRRTLKRVDVLVHRNGPDHYIFESRGMAELAILGRGIPRGRTSVVHLGVDTARFCPDEVDATYVFDVLGIPKERRTFFYAGHFEPRKGVAVIMRAANRLAESRGPDDWQIVLFGNQPGDETEYVNMLSAEARAHVVFGGYRDDLNRIQRGCYAAVIASTGWDSFPRSAMEMQASGLPLLASALPGLEESVENGHTGFLFEPNDDAALADLMTRLLDDPGLRKRLAVQARNRIVERFSLSAQLTGLVSVMRKVAHTA